MKTHFPENFLWGAATSAYQIEGSPTADGGGKSIWDRFCHIPGTIANGDTGDIACDSYRRPEEDLSLLKKLGARAYRFSVSWARVDPLGDGNWNEAGLRYYDRLVDGCLDAGILPYLTLYHWELPQALEDRGGWCNAHTAKAFGRYAEMIARHFQGRVRHYFTLNEPQCTMALGYGSGIHAPGKKLDRAGQFAVLKNQMLAHGYALRAIRAADSAALVGLASTGRLCYPETGSERDLAAARAATFAVSDEDWVFTHHFLLDPVVLGTFPECKGTAFEPLIAAVSPEEWTIIHAVPDFLGYNIYNGNAVRAEGASFAYVPRYPGFPRTALKWPVTPEVLNYGPRFLHERYGLPGYITENGLSCNDKLFLDGAVHDPDRIDFLTRYLRCLAQGIEAGSNVRGYFHWSLLDNFEWHSGYSDRFGLVYMDYPALRRIPKDSFYWFRQVIAENSVP